MKKAHQPILGLVAPRPARKPTPFQTEMLRRAGTILSPGEQQTARARARRDEAAEAEELAADRQMPPDMRAELRGILKRM